MRLGFSPYLLVMPMFVEVDHAYTVDVNRYQHWIIIVWWNEYGI
jgi:hypothetical protein